MTVNADMKWAQAASGFARSAAKRSYIEAASPVTKNNVLAAVRICSVKALTTIGCSRKKQVKKSVKFGIIQK
jgi:hypothetical protein